MRRYIMQIVSVTLVLHLLISPSLVAAGNFIDDWLENAQSTSTSIDYYEGQRRGYYTFGSFSARWPTSVDYPITIVPPRMKAGCGGIDLFAGSFSFVDFEYLVSKLQKLIQSAPVIAFDIALQVLSEQLRNAGIDIEGILNKLNSLQFDDCKASKALVATLAEPGFNALGSKLPGEYATAASDFLVSSGISDLYKGVTQKIDDKEGKAPDPNVNRGQTMESCPEEIQEIFATGSLVNNITKKFGYSDYRDIIRGIIGDIIIKEESDNIPAVVLINDCIETDTTSLEAFLEGNIKAMNIVGECVSVGGSKGNIINYVKKRMRSYVESIKDKRNISSEDKQFLEMTPLPIALALKHAVVAEQEDYTIETLSEVVAYNLINRILTDFLIRIENILKLTEDFTIANQGISSNPDSNLAKCNLVLSGIEKAKDDLNKLSKRADNKKKEIQKALQKYNEQIDTYMQLVQRLEYLNEKIKKRLVNIFNKGVANRVIK